MKTVLILSYSNLSKDPRILKQIRALIGKYRIVTGGLQSSKVPDTEFFPIHVPVRSLYEKLRYFFAVEERYWDSTRESDYRTISKSSYDLIIANDIETLPLAVRYKNEKGCLIYFDAHEFHPREFEDNLMWRVTQKKFKYELCRKYMHAADVTSTVSKGIAAEYKRVFGVEAKVVTNASAYQQIKPTTVHSPIRLVHHGGAIRERNLELMIDIAGRLGPDYSLTFFLVPSNPEYLEELKRRAEKFPNISFRPPVENSELSMTLNDFDIGIYLLKPTSFNNKHALPNKIFEFVQARLCIAIAPSPEMADLVETYGVGVVSQDFSVNALAKSIKELTEEKIYLYKMNADKSASELSSESELKKIEAIVSGLMER